MILSNTRHWQN